jgi:CheY-like chemotaxis protein
MQNVQATLLIVDDEPSVRESLSYVLAEIGYRVRSAEDGFSALYEMRQEVPKLLLSDLNMPNMSGFELLSIVRRRYPGIQTIAMSGSFSGDEVPSGVAADGFYQKGSSIAALLWIITSLPHTDRLATRPSSSEVPDWIDRNAHEPLSDGHITITCPECMRSFPQAFQGNSLQQQTDCIYCERPISYALDQPENRMPLHGFQRETAASFPPSPDSSNLNY